MDSNVGKRVLCPNGILKSWVIGQSLIMQETVVSRQSSLDEQDR